MRTFGQGILLMKIDFEKSYDGDEWHFVNSMLKEIGFEPKFIKVNVPFFLGSQNTVVVYTVSRKPLDG
jgi:hypothetical protein